METSTQPVPDPASATPTKPDLAKRFIAFLIDGVIAVGLGFIPMIGSIAGAAYFLVRDGLDFDFAKQASVGKQVMKLRPVRLDGLPMDLETSIRRNWMFGLGILSGALDIIPILGLAFVLVIGFASFCLGVYELYNVLTDPQGRRWGDRYAGTRVIEVQESVSVSPR